MTSPSAAGAAPGALDPRANSTRALEAALHTGDLAVIEACTEDLLAPDVCWIGSRGGACRSRDEVLTVLRTQLDEGLVLELVELHPLGDQVLLHVGLRPRGGAAAAGMPWRVVLTLDSGGLIVHMQDYGDAAAARRDMALRTAGPDGPDSRDADTKNAGAVAALVPFVHVTDVDVAAEFYALLGFEVGASYRHGDKLHWISLSNGGANIMLALADAPVIAGEQAVLFYLYSPDLHALRERLVAHGILAGEIGDGSPGPREEMRLTDPDGYCLMIAQIDVASPPFPLRPAEYTNCVVAPRRRHRRTPGLMQGWARPHRVSTCSIRPVESSIDTYPTRATQTG